MADGGVQLASATPVMMTEAVPEQVAACQQITTELIQRL
jgi:hypothetical protein